MEKKKILIATAFPTHGAGSGALVTTQAKSYVEDGHQVHIITGNNRTDFDQLEGIKYHIVPFTAESEEPEIMEGQVPFNYLMFTTHTESTANFWNVSLKELEQYCQAFENALTQEVQSFNPDIIHAQHNWLLSSSATRMGKPVVTTIHGTDLMGYEKSKQKLEEIKQRLDNIYAKCQDNTSKVSLSDVRKIEEIYARSTSYDEINREMGNLIKAKTIQIPKVDLMQLMQIYDDKRKFEFYISEAEKSAQNSQKIIVISEAQRERFITLFPFAKDKVELLENGYDPKTFYMQSSVDKNAVFSTLTSDRTKDGKIDANYDGLVLFVGKFADFKGIDSLLTAAKLYENEMNAQDKRILTLIVGSGALEGDLKAQTEHLQLKNTHFVGRKQHDVICSLQNLCDVSVIPSRDEPFGLVVIEGTACGHPVIGSNSGGIPGILNSEGKELSQQDVIRTPLGLLIKALPKRPEGLTDKDRAELDILSADYTISGIEERKTILAALEGKYGLSKEELQAYLEEYAQSTQALSNSVLQIVNKELSFDGKAIHDYTEKIYSQAVIRDKLIQIFNDAEKLYAKERLH